MHGVNRIAVTPKTRGQQRSHQLRGNPVKTGDSVHCRPGQAVWAIGGGFEKKSIEFVDYLLLRG